MSLNPHPTTIFGRQYIWKGYLMGQFSYHFEDITEENPNGSYIKYDYYNRDIRPRNEDGTFSADRRHFDTQKYDEKTRTFTATLVWGKQLYGYSISHYLMVFDEKLEHVVSGNVTSKNAKGEVINVNEYGAN